MSFLVTSRTTNNIFGKDLWGKMIANEDEHGSLFSLDYLYTKNFDDNFRYYLTHSINGTERAPRKSTDNFGMAIGGLVHNNIVSKYSNDIQGYNQAQRDWDGGYTNNPYPHDIVRIVPFNNFLAGQTINRVLHVERFPNDNQSIPPGFALNAYKRDLGLVPIYTRMDDGYDGVGGDNMMFSKDDIDITIGKKKGRVVTKSRSRRNSMS